MEFPALTDPIRMHQANKRTSNNLTMVLRRLGTAHGEDQGLAM